jgi:hypothetical protein
MFMGRRMYVRGDRGYLREGRRWCKNMLSTFRESWTW